MKRILLLANTIFKMIFQFLMQILSSTTDKGIRILFYHKINDMDPDELTVPRDNFANQMRFLKSKGYNCIALVKAIELLNGNYNIPPKTVVITFDDGYQDNFLYAYPILRELEIPAHIFLTSGYIDTSKIHSWDYQIGGHNNKALTWEQIQQMKGNLITFGSHTVNHPNLVSLQKENILLELSVCKKELEDHLQYPVNTFCYPGGYYNNEVTRLVGEASYQAAFTCEPGINYYDTNPLLLKRTKIEHSDNLFIFKGKLKGYYDSANLYFLKEKFKTTSLGKFLIAVKFRLQKRSGGGSDEKKYTSINHFQ